MKTEKAWFGMSCFWFPEAQFGCASGVVATRVGFTGGTTENATYRNIGDHTEAVELEFDPSVTDFKSLLDIFWSGHDPTVPAVHVGNILSRRGTNEDCKGINEGCGAGPLEEGNPN